MTSTSERIHVVQKTDNLETILSCKGFGQRCFANAYLSNSQQVREWHCSSIADAVYVSICLDHFYMQQCASGFTVMH